MNHVWNYGVENLQVASVSIDRLIRALQYMALYLFVAENDSSMVSQLYRAAT